MSQMKTILTDLMILRNAIERVRELHENNNGECLECSVFVDDGIVYPCRTILALDGDK